MLTIKTKAQKTHEVTFCGISSMNGLLYFEMGESQSPVDYVLEFSNAENTELLLYSDEHGGDIDYVGYTELTSFSRNSDKGTVQISLKKMEG